MNLFLTNKKELRSGWKILRVMMLTFVFAILIAVLASALNIEGAGGYAFNLAILAALGMELMISHKTPAFIGITFKESAFWKDFLAGLAWGGVSIGLVAAAMVFLTREINSGEFWQGFTLLSIPGMLLYWLLVALTEESLFRGYMLSILKHPLGVRTAMVVSAVLFSALHLLNPDYYVFAFLYAFLIGLLFGEVVVRRGNLGWVLGFHFVFNLIQDARLLNFPVQGGEAVFTVVLLVNLALILWKMPRTAAALDLD
ncbi:MAG: CPBP family intramembrane metalloprotease [Anaerolineales bacterium]|nr:CPBP family intramembrane metalloprotease [Anaerolineales bacterium]